MSVSQDVRVSQVTAWDRNGLAIGSTSADYYPKFGEICTYGSSQLMCATSFTKNVVNTSLYATDLAERTTYIPTTGVSNISMVEAAGAAPPFKPVFLLGINLPAGAKAP